MRFAQFLSLLAACPGFASRIGSKPHNNTTGVISSDKYPLKEKDVTAENRLYCKKCAYIQFGDHKRWLFYSWKIGEVDGEKRLITRCSPKQPEESEGFTGTSSASDALYKYVCDKNNYHEDIFQIPENEAKGVEGVKFDFSIASDRCVDILPHCERCAEKKTDDFFWKAVGEGSQREIRTSCGAAPSDVRMPSGWERSPPPLPKMAGKDQLPRKFNKDWCKETFNDECRAPQAPTDQEKGGTNDQETGGPNDQVKNLEASTDRRGLLFWLKLFGVLVVVVAAAAGLYVGYKMKADDDSSSN